MKDGMPSDQFRLNINVIISVEPESESEGEDAPDLSSDQEDMHDQFDGVHESPPLDNVVNDDVNDDDLEHQMSDVTLSSSPVIQHSNRLQKLFTSSDSESCRSTVSKRKVDVSKSTLTTPTLTEYDESVQCVRQKSPEKVPEPPKVN